MFRGYHLDLRPQDASGEWRFGGKPKPKKRNAIILGGDWNPGWGGFRSKISPEFRLRIPTPRYRGGSLHHSRWSSTCKAKVRKWKSMSRKALSLSYLLLRPAIFLGGTLGTLPLDSHDIQNLSYFLASWLLVSRFVFSGPIGTENTQFIGWPRQVLVSWLSIELVLLVSIEAFPISNE